MSSLVEALGGRAVGAVEEVSAGKISVLLDPDAPQATALNTGSPSGFPRINGYLLIPNEVGATVGWINAVRIVRLPYPKRKGMQDFGLVDLPFPSRVADVTPLGTLSSPPGGDDALSFEVRRGVDVFPSVGDPVLLPTTDQLRAIVEGERRETPGRILLGRCPTAAGADVHVDPDKLFGRHLAVLGNTGAGKSCSVAGIIRWSMEAAAEYRRSEGRPAAPNARFIVLDPNGEYGRAFADLGVRLFQVEPTAEGARPLKIPAWLWNGEEWGAFTSAAPGVQRPVLFQALRRLRSGAETPDTFETRVRNTVHPYLNVLRVAHAKREYLQFPGCKNVTVALDSAQGELAELHRDAEARGVPYAQQIQSAESACREAAVAGGADSQYSNPIDADLVIAAIERLAELGQAVGLPDLNEVSEDAPVSFDVGALPQYVDALASLSRGRDLAQFVDSLNLRIQGLIGRGGLAPVLHPADAMSIKLEDWLRDYVGSDQAATGQITVIDLSLVPSEVIHIVVAVLARLTFEALQRYRRLNGKDLPTVLVLEEAHTFVHRDLSGEGASAAGRTCCRVFERIAREGRKFGLGLVLASQRPSEVSPTVLSQCNTFLLHRIVNDRDQELVRRLVPDALGALLRELPSLPSRRGILLGWAAPAPVLVEVRELSEPLRPHSPDPAFWDVWTGDLKRGVRRIEWEPICEAWRGSADQEGEAADKVDESTGPAELPERELDDDDEMPF